VVALDLVLHHVLVFSPSHRDEAALWGAVSFEQASPHGIGMSQGWDAVVRRAQRGTEGVRYTADAGIGDESFHSLRDEGLEAEVNGDASSHHVFLFPARW
jgi:hypothetical protein